MASRWLSIFTASAGRASIAGSATGNPVSGAVGKGTGVVVVSSTVVDVPAVVVTTLDVVGTVSGALVSLVVSLLVSSSPPPHAAAVRASAVPSKSAAERRNFMGGSQLPQCFDPFLEGRMRVEQSIDPAQVPAFLHPRHRLFDPQVRSGP